MLGADGDRESAPHPGRQLGRLAQGTAAGPPPSPHPVQTVGRAGGRGGDKSNRYGSGGDGSVISWMVPEESQLGTEHVFLIFTPGK